MSLSIGERGGHLGFGGGVRSLKISISTRNRDKVLTCENIAAGDRYYFLCSSGPDWKMDKNFLDKELSRLTVAQGDSILAIESLGDLLAEGNSTSVLIGLSKSLKLSKPIVFRFPIKDALSTAEMAVPEEYWEGFTAAAALYRKGLADLNAPDHRAAIASFSEILRNPADRYFSFYEDAKRGRTLAFSVIFAAAQAHFLNIPADTSFNLKEAVAQARQDADVFRSVADSLINPALGVTEGIATVKELMTNVRSAQAAADSALAQWGRLLEEQNTKWIIEGAMAGRWGYKYAPMMDCLAYAFTSLDLEKPLPDSLPALSAGGAELLKQFEMGESYEGFYRLCQARRANRQPLFPNGFLDKVRENGPRLTQPYADMFAAVSLFLDGNLPECLSAVQRAQRSCSDGELGDRLDRLRILVRDQELPAAAEVRSVLAEARQLAQAGSGDAAVERYKRATLMAPDYAPACFELGQFYDRGGDAYRANSYYLTATEKDPLYASAYRALCANYVKQAAYKPMIDLLTGALKKGNDYWTLYHDLGFACFSSGQYQEAVTNYQKALDLNPKSYEAQVQLGLAYQNLKNYAKARECFTRAIQLNPEKEEAVTALKQLDELEAKSR